MRILINLTIIVAGIYLVYKLYKRTTNKSVGAYKFISSISQYDNRVKSELSKRDKTEAMLNSVYIYTSRLKFLDNSIKRRKELEYISIRANMKWNGVELGNSQMTAIINMASLSWIIITLLITVFNLKLLILIPLYRVIDKLIITIFEIGIKAEDKVIEKEFIKFYAPFYHTYKYPINRSVRVADVAKSYYESAGPEIKRMIELLRADCQISEEIALDNLKDRYKLPKVHRMSNQIKLIISGRKLDLTVLDGFHSELNTERRLDQRRELEIKKEKGMKILQLNMLILVEIILYWTIVLISTNASKI